MNSNKCYCIHTSKLKIFQMVLCWRAKLTYSCYIFETWTYCKYQMALKDKGYTIFKSVFKFLKTSLNITVIIVIQQDELWANAHLWYPRSSANRQLTGQKTLPTIWGTYMKLVTKYQISVINSCWEKCDEKCALYVQCV